MNQYYSVNARNGARCHDCGQPAVVTLVEMFADRDTGYRDAKSFCCSHDPDSDEGFGDVSESLGDA